MDGDWMQRPLTVPAQQGVVWGLGLILKLSETWRWVLVGRGCLGAWFNRAGMQAFHEKIKRQLGRSSRCSWGWAISWAPSSEVADTSCAGGVSWMPPATGRIIHPVPPTCHQRHLVLHTCESRWLLCCCKWRCCLGVGWSNEKYSWSRLQTFLEEPWVDIVPSSVMYKGTVQLLSWQGSLLHAGFRHLQLVLVVLLRTKGGLSSSSRYCFPQHPTDEAILCTSHRAKTERGVGNHLVPSLPSLFFLDILVHKEESLRGGMYYNALGLALLMHKGALFWSLCSALNVVFLLITWLFHETHLHIWKSSEMEAIKRFATLSLILAF